MSLRGSAAVVGVGEAGVGLAPEGHGPLDLIRTADFAEGTAAFLARRRPEFTGR